MAAPSRGGVKATAPDGDEVVFGVGRAHASSSKTRQPVPVFHSSPEVIRLVVMLYVRFPLSLRNVEDLLFERGIDICHETVRA